MKIHITESEKQLIEKILTGYDYIYFGSRTTGTHAPHSDLDICIMSPDVSLKQLAALKQAFSDSNLSYKVDLVAFEDLSAGFQKLIKREGVK